MKTWNKLLAAKISFVFAVTTGFGGFAAQHLYSAQFQYPAAADEASAGIGLAIGERLPAFRLEPLCDAAWQPDAVTNASLAGRKTAFAIVKATCPHCRKEAETLHALEPEFGEKLRYVIASVSGDSETTDFAQETGLKNSIFTGGLPLAKTLHIHSVPVLLLLDEDGAIQYVQQGELEPEQERRIFMAFLSGQPIPAATKWGRSD